MARDSIDLLVRANASQFNRELKGANRTLDRFGNNVKKTDKATKGAFKGGIGGGLKQSFGGLIKSGGNLQALLGGGLPTASIAAAGGLAAVAAGAVAAAGAFAALGLAQFESLDALGKQASRLGTSTEALAGLRHAAEQTGSSATTLDKTLERLSKRAYLATEGTGAAKRALKDLGIEATDLASLSVDKQFDLIADAISKVENPSRRMALTSEILGDESRNLINLMSEGSAGIAAYREEAERLGLTLDRESIKKVEAANDAWDEMKKSIKGLGISIAPMLAPIVEWIGQRLTDAIVWAREQFHYWLPVVKAWGQAVGAAFSAVWSIVKPIITGIGDLLGWLGESLGISLGTASDWRDLLITYFATVEFAWENLGRIWEIGVTTMALGLVTLYEDVKNIFLNTIPTVFTSFGSATMEFFSNLAHNVANAVSELWDYIQSGGQDQITLTWKPLADGFNKALDEVGKSLQRADSPLEKALKDTLKEQTGSLSDDLAEHVAKRLEEATGEAKKQGEEAGKAWDGAFEEKQSKAAKALTPNAVSKGTQEAFSVIFDAMKAQQGDPAKQQVREQKKTTEELQEIKTHIQTYGLAVAKIR